MNSLNSGCKQLSRPIKNLFAELQLVHKRHSGNFRQLLKTELVDICKIFNSGEQLYEFAKQWMIPKGVTFKCPMSGSDFQINNLTYIPKPTSILPLGVFRFVVKFKDDLDDNIFSLNIALETRN